MKVPHGRRLRLIAAAALAAAAAAAGSALSVEHQAMAAERAHPPRGRFISVKGVRLHYIDSEGPGRPVVMFHGNGAMIADLEISGLIAQTSRRYRTVVFDRPGYGYSERPRGPVWDARAQARLFHAALSKLGVERPILFGHSWGSLVALAYAVEFPEEVGGLVLAAGFYYPEAQAAVALLSAPAIPGVGDLLRHTLVPFITRKLAPRAIAKMFSPCEVTERFRREFPLALAFRPEQIRASAEELSIMNAVAEDLSRHYRRIAMPVAIIAGKEDELVDTESQSVRLAGDISGSTLHLLPDMGHMLHHFETEAVAGLFHDIAATLSLSEAKASL